MNILFEKAIKAYCPSCGKKIAFVYIGMENLKSNLVYWECNCQECSYSKSGFSEAGFQNI